MASLPSLPERLWLYPLMNLLRGGIARDIHGKPSNCKERRNRVVAGKDLRWSLPKLRKLRNSRLPCRTQREIFFDANRHDGLILIDTRVARMLWTLIKAIRVRFFRTA